jgi:hypothetical protein
VGCEARKIPADGEVFFLDFTFYRTSQDLVVILSESSEEAKQLYKPPQNYDGAKYLHNEAKLSQPQLVGIGIFAQRNDTKHCKKHVNTKSDRNKAAQVPVHNSLLSIAPPNNKSRNT